MGLLLLLRTLPKDLMPFWGNKGKKSLFYPGAGADFSPARCFLEKTDLDLIVYCDYTLSGIGDGTAREYKGIVQRELPDVESVSDLSPGHFGVVDWADFWPNSADSRKFAEPDNCFGFSAIFRHNNRAKCFIFLKTEALGTYRKLWGNKNPPPTYIYLKDHGFGLNWTHFSGENGLYQEARHNPPPYICPFNNCPGWPGYVPDEEIGCGTLYRLSKGV